MSLKLTILGCGGSAGVPMIGNRWGECDPDEPKNRRTRCSALVQSATRNIMIDTGSDFREQLNRAQLHDIDAVLYTHWHGDHINGFEELRYIYKRDKGLIPLYADRMTQERIMIKFPHMFATDDTTGFYPLPIEFKGWHEEDYDRPHVIGDIEFTLVKMHHSDIVATGYRFGNVAYCTDLNRFAEEGYEALQGVETLIIDCNNLYEDRGTKIHANLETVLQMNERIKAPDVVLTHLKTTCDYRTVSARLPNGYRLAYDGMELAIST